MQKLVIGISFPMRRLTSPGDDDARPVALASTGIFDCGSQMHQTGYGAKNPLGVKNQSHQLAQGSLAPQIYDTIQARVVMTIITDLHKQNSIAKLIDHLLITPGLPPFDGDVVLASR